MTVAPRPVATVSGTTTITRGQSATIHVALTGTSQWTVTWSDGQTQPVSGSFDRTVSPQTSITYTITAVSDASAAPCNTGTSSGSAVITVQLPAPASLTATAQDTNSRIVTLQWASVTGATYRLERSTCVGCGWSPVGPGSIAGTSYDYTADPTTFPSAALYHVIAMASGTSDSPPSPFDYATTANVLFAETIGANGVTTIKGSHVQELRKAIDALRSTANLLPAWTDYSAPTGLVYASHMNAMRTALDEAFFALFNVHITFSGETPANGSRIYAYHLNQLRTGVK